MEESKNSFGIDALLSVFLLLRTVFAYLNAHAESRCVVEGEELLNANHIMLIGITSETDATKGILALCLQTSALKSVPHELKGTLGLQENNIEIKTFKCSCKAGLSGTCKHISAVLLKCTRACCKKVLKNEVLTIEKYEEIMNSPQKSAIWYEERQLRLTGIEKDAISFVETCSFLELSDTRMTIKKKHQYYGQVQLGMAILNLEICDVLVAAERSRHIEK
ncbi:hypothetical protein HUJ04_012880 [Dendroctonus ponderosae]|nr:hypothetical protein HUJ04_012880 [Dendroctonus ponderosae]